MTNPETLKDILRDAKREIETWPLWMRTQEPTLRHVEDTTTAEEYQDEELSA